MIALVVVNTVLLIIIVLSVGLIIRDVRALHRSGRQLTDRPVDVDGMSPAGVSAMGNNITH